MKQTHLGECLYAFFDGRTVWLRTSSGDGTTGAGTTNEIALEPAALEAFQAFLKTLPIASAGEGDEAG